MATTLTHEQLCEYADTFLTYGSLKNPVWFIGLEEGGGEDLASVIRKFESWKKYGRVKDFKSSKLFSRALTCPGLDADHLDSGFLGTKGKPARLQLTWSNQLRVLLGMGGVTLNNNRIRELQTQTHGAMNGPTCLMELFPLPCKNASTWIYGDVALNSNLKETNIFATKRAYRDHYLPKRIELIVELVKAYRPAALICTSWTNRADILNLLEEPTVIPDLGLPRATRKAEIGVLHESVVAVCSHPADRKRGPRNAFYHSLGKSIAMHLRDGVDLQIPDWK